ncbi:hypothetical protein [Streptomyces sp. TP-A0356]|uniref:hypothetical protein n=1 Tax=Streptomyces sp. TP-A0356 TaxID=1359208 RepID=UPI0006E41878|nr:hypothetical protein [Streptomyces sp. TP-A0356]
MLKVKKAVTAAVLAGAAITGAAATPAMAAPDHGSLVNVDARNVLSGNQIVLLQNVSVPLAAAFCGVDVNVFSAQLDQGQASCPAQTNSQQLAWAVWN